MPSLTLRPGSTPAAHRPRTCAGRPSALPEAWRRARVRASRRPGGDPSCLRTASRAAAPSSPSLRLGAVAVPLSPQCKQAELAFVFGDAGVTAVLTDERGAARCRGLDARVVTGLEELIEEHDAVALPLAGRDADAVYQYSSGCTGRPKRVPRTHAQLAAEAQPTSPPPVSRPTTPSSARSRCSTPTGSAAACWPRPAAGPRSSCSPRRSRSRSSATPPSTPSSARR